MTSSKCSVKIIPLFASRAKNSGAKKNARKSLRFSVIAPLSVGWRPEKHYQKWKEYKRGGTFLFGNQI